MNLNHIAIIMDGNGRWAKKRNMPRTYGHNKGAKTLKPILKTCAKEGIKFLTVYAFSTENFKRPKKEVDKIMDLISIFINKEIEELKEENVKLKTIGKIEELPKKAYESLKKGIEETKNNDKITLTLAINYGFRDDLKRGISNLLEDLKEEILNKIKIQSLDEESILEEFNKFEKDLKENSIQSYMDTSFLPPPDLLIRTGGEKRLSNFLMNEVSYSEFYFTDCLWPDFTPEELMKAINEYYTRNRRFGDVKGE